MFNNIKQEKAASQDVMPHKFIAFNVNIELNPRSGSPADLRSIVGRVASRNHGI